MKIETDKFLTPAAAGKMIGANTRAVYRAIKRAEAAGKKVTVELFGRTLVPVEAVPVLETFYYPFYSESHQKMVKEWGRRGGTQKGINNRARAEN